MPTSHLVTLPIEILELTLLYLPGQDVIKVQAVWSIKVNSRRIVDFVLRDLGQPVLSRLRSYIARPTTPGRPFRHRFDR